jgi:hypothetical protein
MKKRRQKTNDNKTTLVLQGMLLNLLVSLPALLGFGIILISKGPLSSVILSLGCFLAGFTGIIIILRRESPMSIGSVTGKWALLEGIVFTTFCWGISLYFWLTSLR